jgi:hypothetical protein
VPARPVAPGDQDSGYHPGGDYGGGAAEHHEAAPGRPLADGVRVAPTVLLQLQLPGHRLGAGSADLLAQDLQLARHPRRRVVIPRRRLVAAPVAAPSGHGGEA